MAEDKLIKELQKAVDYDMPYLERTKRKEEFSVSDFAKNREKQKFLVLIFSLILGITSFVFPILLFVADFFGRIVLDPIHIALLSLTFLIEPFAIIKIIADKLWDDTHFKDIIKDNLNGDMK